nr:dihydrofolate reductase [Pandoravirus massiliensis]
MSLSTEAAKKMPHSTSRWQRGSLSWRGVIPQPPPASRAGVVSCWNPLFWGFPIRLPLCSLVIFFIARQTCWRGQRDPTDPTGRRHPRLSHGKKDANDCRPCVRPHGGPSISQENQLKKASLFFTRKKKDRARLVPSLFFVSFVNQGGHQAQKKPDVSYCPLPAGIAVTTTTTMSTTNEPDSAPATTDGARPLEGAASASATSNAVPFSIVVAMTASRAIGQDGKLPWGRLPKEMADFRNLTRATADPAKANALIMGRLTYDSLPRRQPLPGRINVVLTRRPLGTDAYPKGVLVASSLDEALEMVARAEKVFVIGGAQVYADATAHPACAGIWLTQITDPDYTDADAFFPQLDGKGYGIPTAIDEPRQECGISYQRFYCARRDARASKCI